MTHFSRMVSAITDGMKNACADMHSFCNSPSQQFNAEYLFTVATARAIDRFNGPPADPYEIRIEHSTREFARDCLPVWKRVGSPLRPNSTILRAKQPRPNIKRSGRIDIAVYHDSNSSTHLFGSQPLCAIELKGFNPPRHLVLEDLRRNLDFHRLDGATGPSVLDLSFFGALHSRSAKRATNNEQSVKERYRKWITELGPIRDLVTHILTFTVSIDATGEVVEEVNEWVLDTTTIHHFIGAIVVFERPKSVGGVGTACPTDAMRP